MGPIEREVRFTAGQSLMKFITAALLLTVTALSACSGIPRRESDAEMLARYNSYAGDRITEFRTYSSFDSWTPIDDHHVVVQTNLNEAYLLTVFEPCTNLPFATRLAITSRFPNTVSSGFDSIRAGRQTCRISEIRPVNYRQMRADLAEERKNRG
jgi:hypothetical protein